MGLDMRMVALGDMGRIEAEYEWRGNDPILTLVRMFGSVGGGDGTTTMEDFMDGSTPITMDAHALYMMTRFLVDPVLTLHLWGHTGDMEYFDDIISPIFEQFKDAMDLSDRKCIDFYFYASY
jgi:hypothetical protein